MVVIQPTVSHIVSSALFLFCKHSQGKMAVDSLNKTDDAKTQNRKIRDQLGDSAFATTFSDGGGYNF